MRKKGKLTSWNDDKGYGFISHMTGDERTFVHINAFENRSRRPVVGDVITFSLTPDKRGRPSAIEATIAGVRKPTKTIGSSYFLPNIVAFGYLLVVTAAVLVSAIPIPILPLYLVLSSATFAAYALDKRAAKKGGWRTSESTLHLLALIGGWPGALIAQNNLRHKTKKQPFRAIFWLTVVLNCLAFVWLFTSSGKNAWRSLTAAFA